MTRTMKLSTWKRKMAKTPGWKEAGKEMRFDVPWHVGMMIVKGRLDKGWTQEELAKRIGTKQESVSRAERGGVMPSLTFLDKCAKAFGYRLLPPRFYIPKHPPRE